MSVTEKIVDRIKKLLRLSESPSVHEAETAAAQAQRLMTRHRIDVAMLTETPQSQQCQPHWDDVLTSAKRLHNLATWRMTIANALAEANGCKTIIGHEAGLYDLCLIGVADDVALVKVAYEYLSGEVDRMAKGARRPKRQSAGQAKVWLRSWRQGAADRLSERIEDAALQAEEEARTAAETEGGESALVLVTDAIALLDQRLAESDRVERDMNPDSMPEREITTDIDPYLRGHSAADSIALDGHRDKIAGD